MKLPVLDPSLSVRGSTEDAAGPDAVAINTWAHDPTVRRCSYALLAREFGLPHTD